MKIITVDACYIMALERREVLSWLPFGFAGGSFWAAAAEDEAAFDEEAAALICLSAPPCSLLHSIVSFEFGSWYIMVLCCLANAHTQLFTSVL